MPPFSITSSIPQKRFLMAQLGHLYRQPAILLFSLAGLCCVLVSLLRLAGISIPQSGNIAVTLLIGLAILCYPFIKASLAVRHFSKSAFASHVNYLFREKGFVLETPAAREERDWTQICKVNAAGTILILADASSNRFYLDQQTLSTEQRQFIIRKLVDSQMGRLFRKK